MRSWVLILINFMKFRVFFLSLRGYRRSVIFWTSCRGIGCIGIWFWLSFSNSWSKIWIANKTKCVILSQIACRVLKISCKDLLIIMSWFLIYVRSPIKPTTKNTTDLYYMKNFNFNIFWSHNTKHIMIWICTLRQA